MNITSELLQTLKAYRVAASRMCDRWAEGDDAVKKELWRNLHSLETNAIEVIERAEASGMGGWQPIESAPKDGATIHLGFQNMQNFDCIAHWDSGDWALTGEGEDAVRLHGRPKPTHWMPLPKAPAVNAAGQP